MYRNRTLGRYWAHSFKLTSQKMNEILNYGFCVTCPHNIDEKHFKSVVLTLNRKDTVSFQETWKRGESAVLSTALHLHKPLQTRPAFTGHQRKRAVIQNPFTIRLPYQTPITAPAVQGEVRSVLIPLQSLFRTSSERHRAGRRGNRSIKGGWNH